MKIGYKATYDYKCVNQLYEIGQEYKMDEKPIICEKGFHYCSVASSTLHYYPIKPNFKLLEIQDLSEDTVYHDDKSCSNHIKIIREITDSDELMDLLGVNFNYNESTKTLKINIHNGYSSETTYDKAWRQLTYKDSNGYSFEYTYNRMGQILTYKRSDFWYNHVYNELGYELFFENSNGYWRERTYNLAGKLLTSKDSYGDFREYTYNRMGQILTHKRSDGYSEEHIYDDLGQHISCQVKENKND